MLGLDLITIEKRKRIINDNRPEELSMLGEAQLVYLNSGMSTHATPLQSFKLVQLLLCMHTHIFVQLIYCRSFIINI